MNYIKIRQTIYSLNVENHFNFQFIATNGVIYTQPRIYKSKRIILGERSNAEVACNRDNSSSSPRLHIEMYPMRYTSPTNIAKERRISEEEDEDEENEKDQEDECASKITRF